MARAVEPPPAPRTRVPDRAGTGMSDAEDATSDAAVRTRALRGLSIARSKFDGERDDDDDDDDDGDDDGGGAEEDDTTAARRVARANARFALAPASVLEAPPSFGGLGAGALPPPTPTTTTTTTGLRSLVGLPSPGALAPGHDAATRRGALAGGDLLPLPLPAANDGRNDSLSCVTDRSLFGALRRARLPASDRASVDVRLTLPPWGEGGIRAGEDEDEDEDDGGDHDERDDASEAAAPAPGTPERSSSTRDEENEEEENDRDRTMKTPEVGSVAWWTTLAATDAIARDAVLGWDLLPAERPACGAFTSQG